MLIYLCDDSEIDTLRLKHYLRKYADERKLSFEFNVFVSGESLLAAYNEKGPKPDLIFLDIFLPGQNGVDVARQLRESKYSGGIVFTTSSMEHAMDSYEVNALYYLQKPYDRVHFENAMARCDSILEKARPHFSFTLKKKEIAVPFEDIIFFETAPSHMITLHTVNDTYTFPYTLSQVMQFFRGINKFLQIGRGYIINIDHVISEQNDDLLMTGGFLVQIPIRKHDEVIASIENYRNF